MTGRIVFVTGTSTGIGKTVVTAALAARALAHGRRVTVVKPVQTGADEGDSDAVEVQRLTGVPAHEFTTLAEPLAPDSAARRAGIRIPTVADHGERILCLADAHDLILVEGAGGVLVRLDTDGGTLLDLAGHLRGSQPEHGRRLTFVVVTSACLGTLNHTELTVEALRARGFEPAGLVIGAWPSSPGLAEQCNLEDLPRVTGVPLLGVIPQGAGRLTRAALSSGAREWLHEPTTGSTPASPIRAVVSDGHGGYSAAER